jgi:micrococcal nuclease
MPEVPPTGDSQGAPLVSGSLFCYRAQVISVTDGDTVKLDVDLGFSLRQKMVLRLYGINTPELHGVADATPGVAAKQYLVGLLSASPGVWKPVTIKTLKDGKDKYGRLLAMVFVDGDPIPVNDRMVSAKHAVAYFGGAR